MNFFFLWKTKKMTGSAVDVTTLLRKLKDSSTDITDRGNIWDTLNQDFKEKAQGVIDMPERFKRIMELGFTDTCNIDSDYNGILQSSTFKQSLTKLRSRDARQKFLDTYTSDPFKLIYDQGKGDSPMLFTGDRVIINPLYHKNIKSNIAYKIQKIEQAGGIFGHLPYYKYHVQSEDGGFHILHATLHPHCMDHAFCNAHGGYYTWERYCDEYYPGESEYTCKKEFQESNPGGRGTLKEQLCQALVAHKM